jgi:hypothetical protein
LEAEDTVALLEGPVDLNLLQEISDAELALIYFALVKNFNRHQALVGFFLLRIGLLLNLARGRGASREVYFPVGTLAEHLFEVVVAPNVFLDGDRRNRIFPLLEIILIEWGKLENAIVPRN